MVVSDAMLATIFLWLVTYLTTYRRSLFLGNIVSLLIGFGIILIFLGTNYVWIGVLMALIGSINLIYDLIKKE